MISQSNVVTKARYNFSVIEKRCLYEIIRNIRCEYIENGYSNKEIKDMDIILTNEKLCKLADEKKDAYASLKKLADRPIELEDGNGWLYTHWITYAKYDIKKDIYSVGVSKEIIPYLIALSENFTTYDLTVAIALKSVYTQRMYEICSQYKNRPNKSFFIRVDELRNIMMLEKKYTNGSDFKRRVIDSSQKELKELFDRGQCDLFFDFNEKEKDGKRVVSYMFHVHTDAEMIRSKTDYEAAIICINRISDMLKSFFPRDKKFVLRVVNQIRINPDTAKPICDKLNKKILDYDSKSIPSIIRYVLSEDFGIK